MENLALSFSVVFPLFLYLALGYGAKSIRMLSSETVRQMNNAVFRIFLPVLLFSNVYVTYGFIAAVLAFNLVIAYFVLPLPFKRKKED